MFDFQHRLKDLRNMNKLTQKDLAIKLNVSQNAIHNWENGKREPDFQMLECIANFFNVDIDYLLGRSNYTVVQPMTLAVHFDGDEYTEEELEEIKKFAEFVKSKRNSTD